MSKRANFEELLDGGLAALLNPAASRRKAGRALVEQTVTWLRGGPSAGAREETLERIRSEWWAQALNARGTRWDLGWAELVAGIALAMDLLGGGLPEELEQELHGTPASDALDVGRARFQRFVPVVASEVGLRRVLGQPVSDPGGGAIEDSSGWALDGPPVRGRSHTLMLALLREGLLEGRGPVAATGELLQDDRVGSIGHLASKAKAWWAAYPRGILVSAPIGGDPEKTWAELLPSRRRSSFSGERRQPAWIVGASMAELRAKLDPVPSEIRGWDGGRLEGAERLEAKLSADYSDRPDLSTGNALRDAAWAACRGEKGRRGVVIYGAPGSGKSVLSRTLVDAFVSGPLSALGFAVRVGAREIAQHLQSDPHPGDWVDVLVKAEPGRPELLRIVAETGRLVPIVDGLDELQPAQLEDVCRWLRGGSGWWIATSRPLRGFGPELPPSWVVKVDDVAAEDARAFLAAMGREDLADAVGTLSGAPWTELTKTPLNLALLARVAERGQDLATLDANLLYELTFDTLLKRACRSRRVSELDATVLRRVLSSGIGELALAWLSSEDGVIGDLDLESAFSGAGIGFSKQAPIISALEAARLLVRLGSRWEFTHRTVAEWAAAQALRRRVEVIRRRDGRPGAAARNAAAETEVLQALLDEATLPSRSRWRTVLRFYAPLCLEPLGLLHLLLDPERISAWRIPEERHLGEPWRAYGLDESPGDTAPVATSRMPTVSEALEPWGFAFDLLCLCRWRRREDAQLAWGIAVRRWLLDTRGHLPGCYGDGDTVGRFATAVAAHLPHDLASLKALAARSHGQRSALEEKPSLLLPGTPRGHGAVWWPLLADTGQCLAILEWAKAGGAKPPPAALNALARFSALQLAEDVEPVKNLGLAVPRVEHGSEKERLQKVERASWHLLAAQGTEPSWDVVKARVAAWPRRLEPEILAWFSALDMGDRSGRLEPERVSRRRLAFESLVHSAAVQVDRILDELGACENGADAGDLLACVGWRFRDRDDRHLHRMVERIARRRGFHTTETSPRGASASPAAGRIADAAVMLDEYRRRARAVVEALPLAALEAVYGAMWPNFMPGCWMRDELLEALSFNKRVPTTIDVPSLLQYDGYWSGVEWTPAQLAELEHLALEATGRTRFQAIDTLASSEPGDFERRLLALLPTDDAEFNALAEAELRGSWRLRGRLVEKGIVEPPEPTLAERADAGAPGWRLELLAQAADPECDNLGEVARVARQHQVHAVVPYLAAHLERDHWAKAEVVACIALLATESQEGVARQALCCALQSGWPADSVNGGHSKSERSPGAALGGLLRVDDLALLQGGMVSAKASPTLAHAIRRLGAPAIDRLLVMHREGHAQLAEKMAKWRAEDDGSWSRYRSPPRELTQAREGLEQIAATVLASVDPQATPLERLVTLVLEVAGGDVHCVYASPGPLGSDFMEPGDLNFSSSHVNQALMAQAAEVFAARLMVAPEEWPDLAPVLRHPSESLRLWAFEALAERTPRHEVLKVGIAALEGHLAANDTQWTGRVFGLVEAGHSGGSGSVDITWPTVGPKLISAVRERLTKAHRQDLEVLSAHENPNLRRLALVWSGEIGEPSWADFVVPRLHDDSERVVWAALDALAELVPERLDSLLADLDDSAWTPRHDHALLAHLAPEGSSLDPLRVSFTGPHTRFTQRLTVETLLRCLARAADRAPDADADMAFRRFSGFRGFPSWVELVLANWPEPLGTAVEGTLRGWAEHPNPDVRVVARRWLAGEALLDEAEIASVLSAPEPVDRFSAAECIARLGLCGLAGDAVRIFRAAMAESPTDADCDAIGREPPQDQRYGGWWDWRKALGLGDKLFDRLCWGLRESTAAFADALPLIAKDLPYDQAEACYEPEAEKAIGIVSRLIEAWSVEGIGAVVLLLDQGELDGYAGFDRTLVHVALSSPEAAGQLRDLAGQNATAADLIARVDEEAAKPDLSSLATLLRDRVFPEHWPPHAEVES